MLEQHLTGVISGAAAVVIASSVTPAAAQSTDRARLTIGVAAGWIGGSSLWDVPAQTIFSLSKGPDIFHLHRDIAGGVTMSGHATYFGGPHVGLTGEFTFLGLDGSDSCTLVQDGGDAGLAAACNAIATSPSSIASTNVQAGIVLRAFTDAAFRPYAKGMLGVAFTPGSTLTMRSLYSGRNVLTVYQDTASRAARPTATVAAGVAANPKQGYQFFIEIRDSWFAREEVVGATLGQGGTPPSRSAIKHFPSVFVGFDIVLEKRSGRMN